MSKGIPEPMPTMCKGMEVLPSENIEHSLMCQELSKKAGEMRLMSSYKEWLIKLGRDLGIYYEDDNGLKI